MSLEAAQNLSIPELLRVLDGKLREEYFGAREIPLSQTQLEPEIENLENRAHDILRLMGSLRNSLRPVNRLPPEIISYIARCALEKHVFYPKSIVPLTQVCQYWRDTITSTPENWTLICSGRPGLAKLSLERVKAAGLVVSISFELRREFVDLLLPHAQNIVSLSCGGITSMEQLTQALPHFPKSMPSLRSLVLNTDFDPTDRSHLADPFDFSMHTMLNQLSLLQFPLFPSILSLRTLTTFSIFDEDFQLPIDTLLSFLEENRSLESAELYIKFVEPSLSRSRRKTPISNGLKHLLILSLDTMTIRTLISSIPLQKGGTLEIFHSGNDASWTNLISGVSMNNLPVLSSPTFMQYREVPRRIRLLGPNGSFLYHRDIDSETPFGEFPLLPLTSIRELRLQCPGPRTLTGFRLSFFPSLEILAIDGCSSESFLSPVLPDPTSSPSLKTLAFLDCDIAQDFLAHLAQIALYREKLTSTSLHRVIIIDSKGRFPPTTSIERLRECIPVVELLEGKEFPNDLFKDVAVR